MTHPFLTLAGAAVLAAIMPQTAHTPKANAVPRMTVIIKNSPYPHLNHGGIAGNRAFGQWI